MTKLPTDLVPLIDGDILRYEVPFAAETGWKAMHPEDKDALPPFGYVVDILHKRLEDIKAACQTSEQPVIYFTTGPTFRFDIAKKKPYKGNRKEENKPWHYKNFTVYLRDVLGAIEVTGIEADDQLAIDHTRSQGTTILCSRDKDLRQVPGWQFSWELGKQPSFGPELITKEGWLKLSPKRDKIVGTGLAFFYSQVLTGDATDNIPGLPNCGPVAAYQRLTEGPWLEPSTRPVQMLSAVIEAYREHYGASWDTELLEQGRLCWLTRRLNEDGSPQLWKIGMEE
jgi:5'-3' exonuclease